MPAKFVAFCYVNDSTERLTQEYTVKEITDVTRTDDDYPTKFIYLKMATDKGGGSSDVDKLPSLSAIVDGNHWRSYFGPFAGRAFLLARSDQLNANKTKFSELTSFTGIGKVHTERLISERSTRFRRLL
ncbi:uncharacterized protein OCT59_012893 [Rhizophagus irregularis]|uniref:uncharacterized protein n=1 Tax=Rhizophagus irregularis TaxID=588596 RepID=UPI001C1C6B50|nr:hypothetical protein OCT59_012893 [Rhizophagus irregularis]CAB5197038.1 unnamed protein product [Rhizophagus irregularis]CAG8730634.1 10543_t:CDS:2 [Rhizophagus irregularis]